MSFRPNRPPVSCDSIIHYRPFDKRDTAFPYTALHFDGVTLTGAELVAKLRAKMNLSNNVMVVVRHAKGDMNVVGDDEKLTSYTSVTYHLERLSGNRAVLPMDVGTLLDGKDTCCARTDGEEENDVLRQQAVLRKYTEKTSDRSAGKVSHPLEVTCPCCDFMYSRPQSLSCCGFKACAPCLQFVLGYEKKCPKCSTPAAEVKRVSDTGTVNLVQRYVQLSQAQAGEQEQRFAEKRPRAGLPIVSREVFERLRALDYDIEGQKRRGSGMHSVVGQGTFLSREEMALANRVQQARDSDGLIPMPVMSVNMTKKVERFLQIQGGQRMK